MVSDLFVHVQQRPQIAYNKVDILDQCVGITVDVTNNCNLLDSERTKGNLEGRIFEVPLTPKINNQPINETIFSTPSRPPEPIDLLLDKKTIFILDR